MQSKYVQFPLNFDWMQLHLSFPNKNENKDFTRNEKKAGTPLEHAVAVTLQL